MMEMERMAKDFSESVKESLAKEGVVLGRVIDVKAEEGGGGGGAAGGSVVIPGEIAAALIVGGGQLELADGNRGDGNSRNGKLPVEEGASMELKEKEKEKKEENRKERKEDGSQSQSHHHNHHQQQQPVLLPLHPLHPDEKEKEKEEMEREKVEKEKEKERVRERDRERSREKEKESVARSEKREKREKERDRDLHRREEREESIVEKLDKVEGKGIKMEDTEMVDRKPVDDRKLVEKEGRERGRERDRDKEKEKEKEEEGGEGEKRKKRSREVEKDRDSVNAMDIDGGAGGEKDKEAVHGYGVQQRKRMLRPRGQTNPTRDSTRSRFRPKDTEGTQGRPESTSLIYRVGEGMPEIAKLRKEYVESGERNSSANGSGPTVEIRIPAEVATTNNRQIRGSQLWGTDIYTNDSDIVAVLMHTGYFSPSATPPPNSISELRVTLRILESQPTYTSTLRNSLRSRAWGGGSGCSYSIERCRILKQGGGFVELEPCLTRNPQVSPTLAPAASERTVTTRAASSSAYRQQRFMQEVTIQYNLCNEPWAKYHMSIVADRGLKKSQFTSARLKKGEVLYVETHVLRYELAYDGERATCNGATTATSSFPPGTSGTDKGKEKWGSTERAVSVSEKEPILHNHNGEKSHGNHPSNGQSGAHHSHSGVHHSGEVHECYRWSKCKQPLSLSSMKKKGVPLPEEFVELLEDGLAWEEVQWAPSSVWIRGTEYILTRAQFFFFEKDEVKE